MHHKKNSYNFIFLFFSLIAISFSLLSLSLTAGNLEYPKVNLLDAEKRYLLYQYLSKKLNNCELQVVLYTGIPYPTNGSIYTNHYNFRVGHPDDPVLARYNLLRKFEFETNQNMMQIAQDELAPNFRKKTKKSALDPNSEVNAYFRLIRNGLKATERQSVLHIISGQDPLDIDLYIPGDSIDNEKITACIVFLVQSISDPEDSKRLPTMMMGEATQHIPSDFCWLLALGQYIKDRELHWGYLIEAIEKHHPTLKTGSLKAMGKTAKDMSEFTKKANGYRRHEVTAHQAELPSS